jgi:hypothetical protein
MMRNLLWPTTRALVVSFVVVTVSQADVMDVDGRSALVLQSDVAQLVIDLAGGSIKDFHLLDHGLNPLQWDSVDFDSTLAETPRKARSMGHFLCLDRWGPASEAEIENGMGWHGEASRVLWKVEQDVVQGEDNLEAVMSANLEMAGLSVRRTIRMSRSAAVFEVTEAVTNNRPLGRIYNMVQHPTIGPPFLDETTVVDANAGKGFMQGGSLPNPEQPSVVWPQGLKEGVTPVDLRHLTDDAAPAVVSFVIDAEYGWTTAVNAGQGLLIGYVWQTEEYAWFDAWRHVIDDKPFARGLEFGTSGLHQPFPILVQKGKIFDRQLFVYIDAGETVTRSYLNFLTSVEGDFTGVRNVTFDGVNLTVEPLTGDAIVVDASRLSK